MISTLLKRRAELLLILSILACVFEGALRKWTFRGSEGLITYWLYFAKDILLFMLVLFCRPRGEVLAAPDFKRVLLVSLPLICAGAVLSATSGINIVGGILSLRSLILLPLLTYFALTRLAGVSISGVAVVIGILTIINAGLGFVQYTSPADGEINYYAVDSSLGAAAYEENVRAMGTFSYISGYANLAAAGAWAGVTLLSLARGRMLHVVAGWTIYAAGLVCGLASISRGTVIIVLLTLVVFVLSGRRLSENIFKAVAAILLILAAGYVLNFNPVMMRLGEAVISRHEASEETVEGRTFDPVLEIGPAVQSAPVGIGFGSEQVGGVYAELGIMSFRRFENQFPRIVLETGLIGLVGFVATCIGALYVIVATRRCIADEGLRRVFVVTAFVIGSFFFINVVFNHIASFLTWIIFACTLASVPRPSIEGGSGEVTVSGAAAELREFNDR